jgi:hypothetical protein
MTQTVCDSEVKAVLISPTQRNIQLPYDQWPDVARQRFEETEVSESPDDAAEFLAQIYGLRVTVICKAIATATPKTKD